MGAVVEVIGTEVTGVADTIVEVMGTEVMGVEVTGEVVMGVEVTGVTGSVVGGRFGGLVSATGFVLVASPLSSSDDGSGGYLIAPPTP